MGLKNEIRKATVDAKVEFKKKTLDYKGNTVVFKQPTQKMRREIVDKAVDENGKVDPIMFNIWSVIYLTYDEEDNPVFSAADEEGLAQQPSGGFVDTFAEYATSLMGNSQEEDKESES